MTLSNTELKVMQAISRVTHRPVETLNTGLTLRHDLSLDSLNALELEFELQQGGFPDIQIESLMVGSTIGDVIEFLEADQ
jgi:acyl carrier protein